MPSGGQSEENWGALLRRQFGVRKLRPGQERVMRCLMAGRPALALFPTGAGKSLCYQFPATLLDGVTVVVSPLIALMKDQVEALNRRGVEAVRLDSSQDENEQQRVWRRVESGVARLLYVSPERLKKEDFRARLRLCRPVLMAVDEAHCISEWGHNFRPEYLSVAAAARELGLQRVVALTATATPQVAEDIRRAFGIAEDDVVKTSFFRPNLRYRITPCATDQRFAMLLRRLNQRPGAAVVYVTLQQTAEELSTRLQRAGVDARAYHAGLTAEHRAEAQEAFMEGRLRVVVATMAFGMGIDKADVRAVYHYNLPKTIENYQQESGRAGRDGKLAVAEVLACRDDLIVLEHFIQGDAASEVTLRQLLDHCLRRGQRFEVSIADLSVALDLKPVIIETVLTYLEAAEVVRPSGFRHATRQLRFCAAPEGLLGGRSLAEKRVLERLLGLRQPGRAWVSLDLERTAFEWGLEPETLSELLNALEESGEAVVKRSGLRLGYERVTAADASQVSAILKRLVATFEERLRRDEERLAQVMAFVSHSGCLVQWLLNYFGETLAEPCGQCESCRKPPGEQRPIPGGVVPFVSSQEMEWLQAIRSEDHAVLRQPRSLARFLCGLSSPGLQRAGLTRHVHFGLLKRLPFADVLAQAEAII